LSRRTIIIVVLFAVISLGAVIAGQIFWVKNAYNLQEDQFNKRVFVALSDVVLQIRVMNKDSAITEPVKQVANNYFIANINDTPPPYLLEDLLKDQFLESDLTEDFEYGIYDCFTDSIVFGSRISFDETRARTHAEQIHNLKEFQPDGHYFGVFFPNKTTIILKQLDFWFYSSIIILLIAIFFSYTIAVILKQKKLSEIKADFVNNMTHELKTPISTIGLSAEAIVNPAVSSNPERLAQYANIIRNEANRMRDQVEKVLQTATLTPNKVNMNWEILDLHEIVLRAQETYSVRISELEGSIKNELNATNSKIKGDIVHITNVIYNLLDNACKYCENEPQIRILTKTVGSEIHLTIEDNGIGIKPQHIKFIFDKFYRVPTGNLHDIKGFGLGLFYVRTILKAHHAKISVESNFGKGSIFTIIFKTVK
jgi:two-component system phosphate regulon sensor histidine kinase PhoR